MSGLNRGWNRGEIGGEDLKKNPFFEGFFEALFQSYFNPDIRVSWFLWKNWPLFQIWIYYLKNWRIPYQIYLFIS